MPRFLGYTVLMEFGEVAGLGAGRPDFFVLDPDGNNVEAVCHQPA